MDITGIAKSHQAGIQKSGKASSRRERKLFDSPGEDNGIRQTSAIPKS
ncbi:MAG: hypothetical protein K2N98_01735 [Lachnospiraceae bacterium]|nr:hypothetical protein [Lachnospiraceae bacterium]